MISLLYLNQVQDEDEGIDTFSGMYNCYNGNDELERNQIE